MWPEPVILDSVRRHGISDDNMLHAWRNPIECGNSTKEVTMPRNMQQILDAADALADRFENYEPGPEDRRDPEPLTGMRNAVRHRARAEQELAEAVGTARGAGYSWSAIGAVLGTSGEAARQRYRQLVDR